MVKNALFNILGDIEGLTFMDLFAGTGQIGLEAEKRGCEVIYVEKNPNAVRDIKKRAKGKVITGDVMKILPKMSEVAHIVFADPPYAFDRYKDLITLSLKALKEGGVFILEHDRRTPIEAEDSRRYGDTVLSFWRKV